MMIHDKDTPNVAKELWKAVTAARKVSKAAKEQHELAKASLVAYIIQHDDTYSMEALRQHRKNITETGWAWIEADQAEHARMEEWQRGLANGRTETRVVPTITLRDAHDITKPDQP